MQSYFFSTPGPIFYTGINILQRNINRDVFKGVGNWNKKKTTTKNQVLCLYKRICKVHTFKNVIPKMYIFSWYLLTFTNAFELKRFSVHRQIIIWKIIINFKFFVRMANSYLTLFGFFYSFFLIWISILISRVFLTLNLRYKRMLCVLK